MPEYYSKHTKAIIDAAVELFRAKGYERVSVNEICQAVGITRSSFYNIFQGKREIIDRIIADVRLDRRELTNDLINAKNDFERMWVLCCRYLAVAETFGPELTGSLLRLELSGELDILSEVHNVDKWMISLAENAQASGILLTKEPAEVIAPLAVSAVYYTTYNWCRSKGSFSLRHCARRTAEAVFNVAPECRWPEERSGTEEREASE